MTIKIKIHEFYVHSKVYLLIRERNIIQRVCWLNVVNHLYSFIRIFPSRPLDGLYCRDADFFHSGNYFGICMSFHSAAMASKAASSATSSCTSVKWTVCETCGHRESIKGSKPKRLACNLIDRQIWIYGWFSYDVGPSPTAPAELAFDCLNSVPLHSRFTSRAPWPKMEERLVRL